MPRSDIGKELNEVSKILDSNPELLEAVLRDITGPVRTDHGREGLSAEQALRCAVLKQSRQLTYEELEFHLGDSLAFRAFARLNVNQFPAHSALQENIAAIRESTWEAIHRVLVGHARAEGMENGRTTRIDTTVVDANIHDPTDSSLLLDGVRVLTRYLLQGKELDPRPGYRFRDHRRVVKKRALTILNARKEEVRVSAYRDLLRYAGLVRGYSVEAIGALRGWKGPNVVDGLRAQALADEIERVLGLLDRVMDQTERRVLRGEKVPASQKIVSLFEEHTDIIVKDRRGTHYGHKVCLTGGASNLILDVHVEKGNPADSDLFRPMLMRHIEIHGKAPRQVSADGGFASKDNLQWARAQGVQDCCFAKRRGIAISDMVRSTWIYRKLRRFRAGIESGISALKRAFGMDRCNWSGWAHFQRYVWSIVVSHNLFTMARIRLAKS